MQPPVEVAAKYLFMPALGRRGQDLALSRTCDSRRAQFDLDPGRAHGLDDAGVRVDRGECVYPAIGRERFTVFFQTAKQSPGRIVNGRDEGWRTDQVRLHSA